MGGRQIRGRRATGRGVMSEQKPIKVLIVCAMGMSSSLLETKTIEAGKNAGVEVRMDAITTPDVGRWDWQANWVDVVLVAPQVRYKRKSIAQAANPLGIIVQDIDPITFGMVDGDKLFQQVREAARARGLALELRSMSMFELERAELGPAPSVNAILVAPQVRFLRRSLERRVEPLGIAVLVIEPMDFGMADGEAILSRLLEATGRP